MLSTGGVAFLRMDRKDSTKAPILLASVNTHKKWNYFVQGCGEGCYVILAMDSNSFGLD